MSYFRVPTPAYVADEVRQRMDNWSDKKWLEWFLRNADPVPLIEAGLWGRPRFILDAVPDEQAGALRASWALGGDDAVWDLLCELLREAFKVEAPELPDNWQSGRYWGATAPQWGRFRRDR